MQTNTHRFLALLICVVCCISCTNRVDAQTVRPPAAIVSPPIDTLFIFARNWPNEDVELTLIRGAGRSTATLIRQEREGRPRVVLDSVGPGSKEPEEVTTIIKSFDVWEMNAPNAVGAACKTVKGRRICAATVKDYSLVMKVVSGREVRVQRYTRLEKNAPNQVQVRALADYLLAWARKREAQLRSTPRAR